MQCTFCITDSDSNARDVRARRARRRQASAHAQTYIIQLARHTRYFCCVELYSAADFHCELFVFVPIYAALCASHVWNLLGLSTQQFLKIVPISNTSKLARGD